MCSEALEEKSLQMPLPTLSHPHASRSGGRGGKEPRGSRSVCIATAVDSKSQEKNKASLKVSEVETR